MVYAFKFGDVVEYKVEDKPCILAYPGSFRYSLIQPEFKNTRNIVFKKKGNLNISYKKGCLEDV